MLRLEERAGVTRRPEPRTPDLALPGRLWSRGQAPGQFVKEIVVSITSTKRCCALQSLKRLAALA